MDPAGSVLVGAALWGQNLYNSWKPRSVGIYGTPKVGKTTLDRFMTTPGEMEDIPDEERTSHNRFLGRYLLPKPSRKRVSWKGQKRVVYSSDMGGDTRFWNLWIDDMVNSVLWQQNRIGEHKIFDPFRDDLIRLQKNKITTRRSFMATRIGWNVETTLVDLLTT